MLRPMLSDATPVPRWSRPRQWLVVAIAALALIAAAAIARLTSVKAPPQAGAVSASTGTTFRPTNGQLAELKFARATVMSFRTEHVTDGRIALNADRTTPVFSPFSGRVLRVLANVGDRVRQGQPLFEMDASELVQGQNDLYTAMNAVDTARAQVRLAEVNERRKRELYDAKAGSLQDVQQSQADLVAAKNALRSAETTLATAKNKLQVMGKTDVEIDAILTQGKRGPATTVVAPIAGTITDRQLGAGQFLSSGATTPVFTIGDLTTVWLIANVRETEAPAIRIGQAVEVRVLALPDRVFQARVTSVGPHVDPNTRRVPVRAEVGNPDGALRPEMFATFSIITGTQAHALGVPSSAVLRDGNITRAWVRRGELLEVRDIRLGRSDRGMVEVTSGLAAGDEVVTSGALFVDRAARGD